MDLDNAIAAHSQWKVKLGNAIMRCEAVDAAAIGADDCCELGRWLHGEAREKHSKLAEYQDLLRKHAEFHREAGKIATLINSKKYDEASAMLEADTPYVAASTAVAFAIGRMKRATAAKSNSLIEKLNSNLSIGARLAIVSGLFVSTSAVGMGILANNALSQIDFSKREEQGTHYLTEVWGAMRTGGSVDAAAAEQLNARDAATAFAAAANDEERLNAGLALITAVADGSNLTLDPDLDSFYAMDAATVKLPALLSTSFDVSRIAASTDAERNIRLQVAIDSLNDATDAAIRSIEASMNANASGETRQALGDLVAAIRSSTASFVAAAEAAQPGAHIDADRARFVSATDTAWTTTNRELDRLLDARIEHKQTELFEQVALISVLLATAAALAFLISTGLGKRFKGLIAAMDRLRQFDFTVEVPYTQDSHETGKIADTLEILRNEVNARIEEDKARAEAATVGAEGLINVISRDQSIVEFRPDGEISKANDKFLAMMGYAANEAVGRNHTILLAPEYAQSPEYRAFWQRLLQGEVLKGRYRRFSKSGEGRWLDASYNPLTDKEGKVVKIVLLAYDVTDQEAISQDVEFKSAAFEGSATAVMMVDREFNATHVNGASKELFRTHVEAFRKIWPGLDPDNMVGKSVHLFHKNPQHITRLLSDPSKLPYKTDITIGDIKIELVVSAVIDSRNRYVGNVLNWEDVTQKRVNAGMLDALGRSQAIVEFDLTGVILNANENFCRVSGYSLAELKGKHHAVMAGADLAKTPEYQAFWEKLGRGENQAGKYRRVSKDGREIWFEASYNVILDGAGRPFKVIKLASDVTQIERDRVAMETERNARAEEQVRVVRGLAEGLSSLAHGNLTARIHDPFPGEYEKLRDDFNSAMQTLQEAMTTIIVNANGIQTGAGEISQASDDLSRRTEQQAASLEETAAALDEVTATVKKTAEGSKQANALVATTRGDAEASGQVVSEAVSAMSEIEKSSRQISQIIGVIDEIAFQTNLLALNAGVEAARAGEAGRGFAVVASEVRALAQRSSEAAKEIKGLITASSGHVETGVGLVGEAGRALQGIAVKVSEISGLVSEITASAQEQSAALAEVNTAINNMDQVTQQNAAMVEESTAAAHSLRQEADELLQLMSRFETGAAAAKTGARGAPANPPGQNIQQRKARVAQFASSEATARKSDDWEEF